MRAWKALVLLTAAAIIGVAAWESANNATTAQGSSGSASSSGETAKVESETAQAGTTTPDSLERAFVAGGRIKMDLSAGEYRIEPAAGDRIEMRWAVRDARRLANVRVRAEVNGTDATITADDGRKNKDFRVTIRVPSRTDLHVRLSAGDLTLRGIEGNKDIELNAGELDIDVGRADDYSEVDAGLWAGDIEAAPFRISKDGLFRSFTWRGPGKYRLHAHLMAGEIRLRAASTVPLER